jgi:hypothetical protein
VYLALLWLLEGALLLSLAVAAHRLIRIWQSTRARVMCYPGPYALATYWALEAARWVLAIAVTMMAAATLGWGGVAVACLAGALILEVVAVCSVGLMLPMIAVAPRSRNDSAQST